MTNNTSTSTSLFSQVEDIVLSSFPASPPNESVASILAQLGSPSTSIAILDNNKITSHNISTIPGHNTETLFQACSISKPCAGLTITRLIEKGHFTLDSKVHGLLPEAVVRGMVSDARSEALFRTVTVRQVMSHTAGLSVHGFPGYPVEFHPTESLPSGPEILAGGPGITSGQVRVIAPPGMEFMYSGGGMTVLQVIAETAMGKPFREIVAEEVFKPLGMDRSYYIGWLPRGEENVAETYWTGLTKCETRYHVLPEAAAAGIWCTPADLLKLVRAMQMSLEGVGPSGEGEPFVSSEMAKAMLTRVKASMGLTWFCDDTSMGHSGGNFPGYRCFLYGYADLPWNEKKGKGVSNLAKIELPKGCGISFMTNSATGYEVGWKLIHAITRLKGWPIGPSHMNDLEVGAPFSVHGDIEAGKNEHWKAWIGEWTDEDGESLWKIAEDENGMPVAGIDFNTLVPLKTAAMPPVRYTEDRSSIDLVMDGLEVALRLGWERETKVGESVRRVVELLHFEINSRTVLYRKKT